MSSFNQFRILKIWKSPSCDAKHFPVIVFSTTVGPDVADACHFLDMGPGLSTRRLLYLSVPREVNEQLRARLSSNF